LAWETLFPAIGPLPVTWQTRAMIVAPIVGGRKPAILAHAGGRVQAISCLERFRQLSRRIE
jgi:hypothetical protein